MLENLSDFLGIEENSYKTKYESSVAFQKQSTNAFAEKIFKKKEDIPEKSQSTGIHSASELYSLEQHRHLYGNSSSGWTCLSCGKIGNVGDKCSSCNFIRPTGKS